MKNIKSKPIFLELLFFALVIFFTKGCASTEPILQTGKIPQDFVSARHLVFIGLDGAKLTEMDGLISIIEQAVKDAGIYDDTIFVLSADHGGKGYGHELNTPKRRNTPLIIYGNGIKQGFEITSHVNIYDITPTMAALLGMDIPSEWTGRILYEIF